MAPAPAKTSTRLVTIPQAADRCGLSTRFFWSAISSGAIKVVRFGKRATRIDEAELERFVDAARTRRVS